MPDGVVAWHVVDVATGEVLMSERADEVLRTASVAKLLVLAATAQHLDLAEPLSRTSTPPVADSGLWHLMATNTLLVADVALLVAAVSDNWATNVLVERLGLDTVNALAPPGIRLHDLVRDARGPSDPPTLSTGTARAWTDHLRTLPGQVRAWLAAGVDHSLALSAYGLDPLVTDGRAVNKTGSDTDVRCDVGLVDGLAYAVLGNGDPADLVPAIRAVGHRMRRLSHRA